jgi:predicted ATPase
VLEDRRTVQERADALLAISTEQSFPLQMAVANLHRGWTLSVAGETGKGKALVLEAVDAYRATGQRTWMPSFLALSAAVHERAGEPEHALRLLDEALDAADATGERMFEAELYRLRGRLLLLSGTCTDQVETFFEKAIAVARLQGAKLWELRAIVSMARLWHNRGKSAEARELLAPIYRWFTEGFDTPDLKEAKALLEELA